MGVANIISPFIMHHDTLVVGVKLEAPILPSLLLAAEVVGEETGEFEHRRSAGSRSLVVR